VWNGDVCFQNASGNNLNYAQSPQNWATWTAGYAKGTTQITLSAVISGSAPKVGTVLNLDQINDYTGGSSNDNGHIWVCGTGAVNVCCTSCQTGAGRDSSGGNISSGSGNQLRQQQQFVKITAISGTGPYTVTLEDPIYMPNWRSSQKPGAWWSSYPPISGNGIENLSLNHSASSAAIGILFFNAYGNWVKGVRDLQSDRSHVDFYQSVHNTIRDSYFYGTKNAASESYGVEHFQASSNLVENNIFQHIVAPMLSDDGSGSVFGYNFSVDDYYAVNQTWMQPPLYHHGAGNNYFLWEGNQGQGLEEDAVHGTAAMITAFRNRLSGTNTNQTAQTIAVHIYAFTRYSNIIGNVLGTAGYHNAYQSNAGNIGNCETSIYALGLGGSCWDQGTIPNDPVVISSLMRWGNYDTVNAASRFVSSEVPSGIDVYPNPVPANNNLPASFYLSAKPNWWGTMPWPAVGPDVTGGNVAGVGGRAYNNPAANCYLNVMGGKADGSSGILTFNADNCYSAASAVPPPTGLVASPH
jgi:hypothetical protein